MTTETTETSETSTDRPSVISAFFAQRDQVDRVVGALVDVGVPRDLIEVVVSPEANKAQFGGRARRLGSQTVRYAGAGALLGLLVGVVLSLEIILVFPGAEPPARSLSVTQLLGPNVAMMIGLVLGALVGSLLPRRPDAVTARVRGREEILVVVRSLASERVREVATTLEAAGGHDTVIAAASRRRLWRW